ncbi:MAG: DUF4390 domain-containing protein [Burkholderiales bacterium]
MRLSACHRCASAGFAATAMRARVVAWLVTLGLLLVVALAGPAQAGVVEARKLDVQRTAEGVFVDLETRFDLPQGVEDALQKGVALHFAAEAQLLRARWYWRDQRLAQVKRTWRLSYQPLTLQYRVSLGGLSQTYGTLAEALRSIQRTGPWRLAEPLPAHDDGAYYVELTFRLDTDQLPRPLQIGLSGQAEWTLELARTVAVPNAGQ